MEICELCGNESHIEAMCPGTDPAIWEAEKAAELAAKKATGALRLKTKIKESKQANKIARAAGLPIPFRSNPMVYLASKIGWPCTNTIIANVEEIMGSRTAPFTINEIHTLHEAKHFQILRPTISNVVKHLEERGVAKQCGKRKLTGRGQPPILWTLTTPAKQIVTRPLDPGKVRVEVSNGTLADFVDSTELESDE